MFRKLTVVSFAALIALTSFGYAQETATDEPTTTETPSIEPQLDMGQVVTEGPQIGDRYAKNTFGSWELACFMTVDGNDPCSLVQILTDATGNPTAEVSLFRIANGGVAIAGLTVVVPLETSLPAQLTISVDGAPGKRYVYSFCNPIGCIAQIGLTQEDVDAFKKGNVASVSLVPAQAPDQVISLEMPLNGFTAGYNSDDIVQN
ncbi:MAG: invasion associated locus B family protein [Rhodobacteraceae bacterium]|nr:invasion associated locus B family protein [Paracoccaceae bacterium]